MAASDGSAAAEFADWIRPHWAAMSALSFGLVGAAGWEDVLQDALALAWRKRHRYQAAKGTARAWLLALTVDCARRNWRRQVPAFVSIEGEFRSSPYDSDTRVDVERALTKLSRRQRLAIELFYFMDLSVSDVAIVMRCSEGTAKSTLSDARRRLRPLLERDSDE